jgi:hypothetical protein
MLTDAAMTTVPEIPHDLTFSQSQIDSVLGDYVCAVCHADLEVQYILNDSRVIIFCAEHGNVCQCGRVTRNTVSIEHERGFRAYHDVIRNLSDLWGVLADEGFERERAAGIRKHYVCAVCGSPLNIYARPDDPRMNQVNIGCDRHGNINACGHIRKDLFVYDFQRIREWEKNNRRSY